MLSIYNIKLFKLYTTIFSFAILLYIFIRLVFLNNIKKERSPLEIDYFCSPHPLNNSFIPKLTLAKVNYSKSSNALFNSSIPFTRIPAFNFIVSVSVRYSIDIVVVSFNSSSPSSFIIYIAIFPSFSLNI